MTAFWAVIFLSRHLFVSSSRCTVMGENAGMQMAMYSVAASGVEYWTHSPG